MNKNKPPAFSGRGGGRTSLGPRDGYGGRGGRGRGKKILNRGTNNGNYIGKRNEGNAGEQADNNNQKVRQRMGIALHSLFPFKAPAESQSMRNVLQNRICVLLHCLTSGFPVLAAIIVPFGFGANCTKPGLQPSRRLVHLLTCALPTRRSRNRGLPTPWRLGWASRCSRRARTDWGGS